ncbi:HVO_2922 family protein [Haloarcula marina]|uniref:HVO_2922 family protein n=1 Tax=Haloarcula marina TaxID=2961574 RepID=UPI0020B82CA6|nr:HVO_2922 family protein [Halomicroarcula marina]
MSDDPIYQETEPRTRKGLASYFYRLSRALRRGEPVPADEEQSVTVDPAAESDLTVDVTRDGDEVNLDIGMSWTESDEGDIETDVTASKATFERYQDTADEWRWRLVHNNGNIIADCGEGYASKQKATQGLDSVKENAPGAHILDTTKDESTVENPETGSDATFELFTDSAEKFRWRLVHDNGDIIADGGQGYASKQKATQGLRSVQTNARGAPVVDE